MRVCRPVLLEITKNNVLIFLPTMGTRNIIIRINLIKKHFNFEKSLGTRKMDGGVGGGGAPTL